MILVITLIQFLFTLKNIFHYVHNNELTKVVKKQPKYVFEHIPRAIIKAHSVWSSAALNETTEFKRHIFIFYVCKSRKENPLQKLTQLSARSHPRHLVRKRTAQKDTIIDITSDSQVNSNFPNRWSPASLTFNNYFYLFSYLYIT